MTGILLIQLGSPLSANVKDVREYLEQFLSDPRLIDPQPLFWKWILKFFILPKRSPKSAQAYERIWDEKEGFPLIQNTNVFVENIREFLAKQPVIVEHAFLIGQKPSIHDALKKLKEANIDTLKIIPLFPQFSEATTLSAEDSVKNELHNLNWNIEYDFLYNFHRTQAWVQNLANSIDSELKKSPSEKLILSFHGYPKDRIFSGDSYFIQCVESARLIASQLKNIQPENIVISFQSKFGKKEWLEPSTEQTLQQLAKEGIQNIAIACPAFVVDNLETLDEVNHDLRNTFLEAGGKQFTFIPCLNTEPLWVESFANEIALPFELLEDSEIQNELEVPEIPALKIPDQGVPPEKISPSAKKSLKTLFLTLFLDLAGFSIIFPLFPALLTYYLNKDSGPVFNSIIQSIQNFGDHLGIHGSMALPVLFGGTLAFLYSFLQFLISPYIGRLSDRIGRKPILITSLSLISFSYVLWFFSENFWLFLVSRIIGGLSSANISVASAIVADITSIKTRSKGMAVIGIAFGTGFLIGPALGGIGSLVDLSQFSFAKNLGVNPFSFVAFLALILSLINLRQLIFKLPETLPETGKTQNSDSHVSKSTSLLFLNSSNFIFLLCFSGAEFTLTFLAAERLQFTPAKNTFIFLFAGIVTILIQGGYARRKLHNNEKKMAIRGFLLISAGFFAFAFAQSLSLFFFGVALMAAGTGLVSPSLSALISNQASEQEQGKVLGRFRSLGALARTLGPLLGGFLFWRYGSSSPYIVTASLLILPLLLLFLLKAETTNETIQNS